MTTDKLSRLTFTSLDNGNILYAELRHDMHVDITAAIEMVQSRVEFMNDCMHYLIMDASKVKSMTTEAKEYLRSPEGGMRNLLGAALIAANPVSALIANFFIKVNKDFQARFFSNRWEAMEWIHQLSEINPLPPGYHSNLTVHHP